METRQTLVDGPDFSPVAFGADSATPDREWNQLDENTLLLRCCSASPLFTSRAFSRWNTKSVFLSPLLFFNPRFPRIRLAIRQHTCVASSTPLFPFPFSFFPCLTPALRISPPALDSYSGDPPRVICNGEFLSLHPSRRAGPL